MLTLAKLFGKSPFAPLQTHMDKVASCVAKLPALFDAILAQNSEEIETIAHEISRLEHEADLTKNDIRNHLPKSLFLPVDRGALLEILSLQDALADTAEEIGKLAMMRSISLLPSAKEAFPTFCAKNIEAFGLAKETILELEQLLDSSFGGIEAQKVKAMVEKIAFCEYEMDLLQNSLITKYYRKGDELPFPLFHLTIKLIEKIGNLACFSEKLGNRVRMLLELK